MMMIREEDLEAGFIAESILFTVSVRSAGAVLHL